MLFEIKDAIEDLLKYYEQYNLFTA